MELTVEVVRRRGENNVWEVVRHRAGNEASIWDAEQP